MADDLDKTALLHLAMAMMKVKPISFEELNHFNLSAYLPVMISCYDDNFAMLSQFTQEPRGFAGRGPIMDQIAQDDQTARPVFLHEPG